MSASPPPSANSTEYLPDTTGIRLSTGASWLRSLVELLSSMRFAVSLLTLIAITSVIGTVLKQNEPSINYLNEFGPFWYQVFDYLGLYRVYNTWWFMVILGFLVISTSLCVTRNTPKILKDIKSFRDHVRRDSLVSFPHRAVLTTTHPTSTLTSQCLKILRTHGFAVRLKPDSAKDSVLISAKAGSTNRLGYILAHSAIVVICLGGLLDSDLAIHLQRWWGNKQPVIGNMALSAVPANAKLSLQNPSFRASVSISEGDRVQHALISAGDGVLLQPLPFSLALKKFTVEYYSTGMPKDFTSEVQVTDGENTFPATIKVNQPLQYKGFTVYQASFDDGGSHLNLRARPLNTGLSLTTSGVEATDKMIAAVVGQAQPITITPAASAPAQNFMLEISGFKAINVEDLSQSERAQPSLTQGLGQTLGNKLSQVSGAGINPQAHKRFHNIGPSVQYKLRDSSGQAREYFNYMLPVTLDNFPVFLWGVRDTPNETFRYVRVPADQQSSVDGFLALRTALANPLLRSQAAQRFAAKYPSVDGASQLQASAQRALDTYAQGGLQAVASLLESGVPPAEQQRAAELMIKLMSGCMFELWSLVQQQMGQTVEQNAHTLEYVQLATTALSDLMFYPAPVIFTLNDFQQIQASVFQVARTPGKYIVYLGCLLLILGIFAMFYIRQRRAWIWISTRLDPETQHPSPQQHTELIFALTAVRRTLDFDREFIALQDQLRKICN